MTATLIQLRRLTRGRVGIPMSDDFLTDPILDDHINLAVETIEAEYRWPWNEMVEAVTVTSAAPDIPLPTGYRATRAVFDQEMELSLVSPADIMSWVQETGANPRVWCPMGDVVVIRPTVQDDRTLTHYWARQSVWMRQDEDRTEMPEQFMGAIVAKAAELLSMREGAGADAGRHNADYKDWLTRMRRDVRRSTPSTRVRVRPGSWIP